MRRLLLAAAAAAAIATPAAAETTGSLGVQHMNTKYDYDFDYDTWSIGGDVFHRIAGPWAVQAQGYYEDANYGHADDDGGVVAVHGLYQTNTWTAGVFVGEATLFDYDDAIQFVGLEGAYRVGNWGFDAYGLERSDRSEPLNRYGVDARYYFGDNVSLGAGYAREDYGVDFDDWKLAGEWRLNNVPLTFTGGYYHWEADTGSSSDDWTVGVRWDFGSGNLREHDRTSPIPDLNNYLDDIRRWD